MKLKRIMAFAAALCLCAGMSAQMFFAGGDYRGDINYDGDVTMPDAVLALQHVAKLIDLSKSAQYDYVAADVNQDGDVNLTDAVLILQKVAKISDFPPFKD